MRVPSGERASMFPVLRAPPLVSGVSGAISAFKRISGLSAAGRVALYQPTPETMSASVKAPAKLYGLPTALPLPEPLDVPAFQPDELQRKLGSLGYPGFEHVRAESVSNPAEVVLSAVVKRDLDTRLVEALPWVLST